MRHVLKARNPHYRTRRQLRKVWDRIGKLLAQSKRGERR